MKKLNELALNITEQEYRDYPALNYSKISRYNKDGFSALSHLDDKVDSPSLLFGSAVDCYITEGSTAFNEKYIRVPDNLKIPNDNMMMVLNALDRLYEYKNLEEANNTAILEQCENYKLYDRYKEDTKLKYVRDCNEYYMFYVESKGKQPLSSEMYDDVLNTVNAIKATGYFEETYDGNVEVFYQLKFVEHFDGIPFKCMADAIVVNHNTKTIHPIDLKTSSKPEYEFYKSFVYWNYDLQARLYWRIIRNTLDRDSDYKDYKLNDYRFIVCNSKMLNPLVWIYDQTTAVGDIVLNTDKGNKLIFKDPVELGKEIHQYLSNEATLPNGIEKSKSNNLLTFIKENL